MELVAVLDHFIIGCVVLTSVAFRPDKYTILRNKYL